MGPTGFVFSSHVSSNTSLRFGIGSDGTLLVGVCGVLHMGPWETVPSVIGVKVRLLCSSLISDELDFQLVVHREPDPS